MDFRIKTVPARPARRTLGIVAAASTFALLAGSVAQAQTPPAQPAQRPAQRPAQPAQRPAQQPAQPAQPQAAAPAAPQSADTPPLIYSPWTKVCGKDQQQPGVPAQKEVCFTIKEARLDTGQFVASAGLIELEGEQKKVIRVTLPLGLLLRHGTRMVVDTNPPMTGVYNFCLPNGCWADFEINPDFVGRLKKGTSLVLQAFNLNGQVASFAFPLVDFAKANEGAPTDPKVLEEQQKKLQDELQRRADEARKKLEQQQSAPPAAAPKP
jgi:invasion protein IalB